MKLLYNLLFVLILFSVSTPLCAQGDTIIYPKYKWEVSVKSSLFHWAVGIARCEVDVRWNHKHSLLISPFYMYRRLKATAPNLNDNYTEGKGIEVFYRMFGMLDASSDTRIFAGVAYQYREAYINFDNPNSFIRNFDQELGFYKLTPGVERMQDFVITNALTFQLGIEQPLFRRVLFEFFTGIGARKTISVYENSPSFRLFNPGDILTPNYSGVDIRLGIRMGLIVAKGPVLI